MGTQNIYHILNKVPIYEKDGMNVEYEDLCLQLLDSGLVRIDTYSSRNFVVFLDPDIDRSIVLSKDELDLKLIDRTKQKLANIYSGKFQSAELAAKIKKTLLYFKGQMLKNVEVEKELQLQLIRILAGATQPIVLRWILLDRVEIYISYSYNIGDVLDVVSWQESGTNNGMQSTDGKNVAVFVSCGGDPFRPTSKEHPTYGDGWPAMARIQVVAGQELGHYSDIRRDAHGRQIDRHSANFSCTRATDNVKMARKLDIKKTTLLYKNLGEMGLRKMIADENSLKFYNQNNVMGLRVWYLKIGLYFRNLAFFAKVRENQLFFLLPFKHEKYTGLMIQAMMEDMLFNLTPQADVYNKKDPEEDEAIKCIEALARVPQQVMKWGYMATKALMPGLYEVYYTQVIPSLVKSYQDFTGQTYQRNYATIDLGIIYKIKKFFKKTQVKPVREL